MAGLKPSFPMGIASIILQTTCTNLETLIRPLTILDNILSGNFDIDTMLVNAKDVLILKHLFSTALSNEEYIVNKYIWTVFSAFINRNKYG